MPSTRSLARSPSVFGSIRAAFRYLADRAAPLSGKLLLAAAAIYLVLPMDLLPDVMPVVGWLDDVGVAGVAWLIFKRQLDRWEESRLAAA